jgi:hypothetical protein
MRPIKSGCSVRGKLHPPVPCATCQKSKTRRKVRSFKIWSTCAGQGGEDKILFIFPHVRFLCCSHKRDSNAFLFPRRSFSDVTSAFPAAVMWQCFLRPRRHLTTQSSPQKALDCVLAAGSLHGWRSPAE